MKKKYKKNKPKQTNLSGVVDPPSNEDYDKIISMLDEYTGNKGTTDSNV